MFHSWGEDLAAFVTFARDTVAGDEAVEKTIGLTEQNTWFGWPLVLLSLVALVLLVRRSLTARIARGAGGGLHASPRSVRRCGSTAW